MKTISASEARARFREIAAPTEPTLVIRHSQPVALVLPVATFNAMCSWGLAAASPAPTQPEGSET